MRVPLLALACALLLACDGPPALGTARAKADPEPIEDPADRWRFHLEEARIDRLLADASRRSLPDRLAFINVMVVDPTPPGSKSRSTVLVSAGRIERVVAPGSAAPEGYHSIPGEGRFLVPGLVDMHVHSLVSSSQKLLNLANGVTSVRDLCGFPWLLRERAAIRQGRLLAPNLYVSGQILNSIGMGRYARVVRTPDEGRAAVRDQIAAGYDFIKVHNRMPRAVYLAVADEARRAGVDLVGHIPHELTIREALGAGQRTFEHLKGYYLDRTLEMTDEPWLDLTRGADVWNTPTLYTRRMGLRGAEALALLDGAEEMRYVSVFDRAAWRPNIERPNTGEEASLQVYRQSQRIVRDLRGIGARFLAGTDSGGGYAMMIPGFALHEELALLVANGLSPAEALAAATFEAARALRRESEFGRISSGLAADLVLVNGDPLADVANLRSISGVAVRGRWLARDLLDELLAGIAAIYAHAGEELVARIPGDAAVSALVAERLRLAAEGFVARDHDLEELARLLEIEGRGADAVKIRALCSFAESSRFPAAVNDARRSP